VVAAVFHVARQTDRHDETKIHFFAFFECAQDYTDIMMYRKSWIKYYQKYIAMYLLENRYKDTQGTTSMKEQT